MNECLLEVKRKIQILVIGLNLCSFIIVNLIVNRQKDNYVEYTSLSKFCSNFYIIAFYILILIHSISPKILCGFILNNISFISTDIGKLVINWGISILYWSSNNTAHLIFGIITFISSLVLFLSEFIFQCRILKDVNFEKENPINKGKSISSSSIIDNNN